MVAVPEPDDLEPRGESVQQLAPGIGVMVILGVAIDVAVQKSEQGMRPQTPFCRYESDERAAGAQYPMNLIQGLFKVRDMLEYVAGDNHIVSVRGEGQRRIRSDAVELKINRPVGRANINPDQSRMASD